MHFLTKILHTPKAWFEVDKTNGLVPFAVTFKAGDIGANKISPISYHWNFGDGTETSSSEPTITKVYDKPGIYDVSLTMKNAYGEDSITLAKLIKAKTEAPQEAILQFTLQEDQVLIPGNKMSILRTPVGQIVKINIPEGKNPSRTGYSYAGELLDDFGVPIDPITSYSWALNDDLPHGNNSSTVAAYSLGGLHDLVLRVDTLFNSYRITNYEGCIDVVEPTNLWLWTFNDYQKVSCHEFGIYNETFKTRKTTPLVLNIQDDFLESERQRREFWRNNGIAKIPGLSSGFGGTALLFWASGRSPTQPASEESIESTEYNAFSDSYNSTKSPVSRPWNWAALASPDSVFFLLGNTVYPSRRGVSLTNMKKTELKLSYFTSSETLLDEYCFINGAEEVRFNSTTFNEQGHPIDGHFSSYRTAWRNQTGYLLKGMKNFYKTDGMIGSPFQSLKKLTSVPGDVKNGQLVSLSSGVYLFNNSSMPFVYKEETATWQVAGSSNPGLFRTLQDNKVVGFDDLGNNLLAASDGDKKAYLSFDYSHNSFLRFNESDLTFSSVGKRPQGQQWLMGIF
jgi:PKD repeat protein